MLKKSHLCNLLLLLFVGSLAGCQSDTTAPVPDSAAYFPLQTGDYWIYQVTQTTYTRLDSAQQQVYQLQQKISDTFTRNGQLVFLIEQSVRQPQQTGWQSVALSSVYSTPGEVVATDNNMPVVRLVFPVTTATSWNRNQYNTRADTVLHYGRIGQSFALGNRRFEQTVSVVGANDSSLVSLDKQRWVYALNVGLIYREEASLAYCQSSTDCIGKALIESGTTRQWRLIDSNRLR